MKKRTKGILFVITVILIFGTIQFFKLSDLQIENYTFPNNQVKAKQLLEQMGTAHRIHLWDSIDTYTVVFKDEFYGFFGKQAHPFKEQNMEFQLSYIPNTSNGQLKITSGKENGTTWGLQSGETYQVTTTTTTSTPNEEMKFWIPTYQYFIEFPSRIQEATAIDYMGEKVINGIKTEGVIASWNTVAPQKDIDQYVIWIATDTKRIVKLEYTVRDAYNFVSGAAYFNDYKEYNGILLPTKMPVESNLVKDSLLHLMRIDDFKPNQISLATLLPLDK